MTNFNAGKANDIHAAAKEQIALTPSSPTSNLLIHGAVAQVTSASRMVETLRSEMDRLASQLPEYSVVLSMYGVGKSLEPPLMAELDDISRFKNRHSLAVFAGVNPMPNQSGMKNVRSNRSSKRGSPYLRQTLFKVMTALLQNTPAEDSVYQFLDRKRAEGKPFYVYMNAGANKFLRVYYRKVIEYL